MNTSSHLLGMIAILASDYVRHNTTHQRLGIGIAAVGILLISRWMLADLSARE